MKTFKNLFLAFIIVTAILVGVPASLFGLCYGLDIIEKSFGGLGIIIFFAIIIFSVLFIIVFSDLQADDTVRHRIPSTLFNDVAVLRRWNNDTRIDILLD